MPLGALPRVTAQARLDERVVQQVTCLQTRPKTPTASGSLVEITLEDIAVASLQLSGLDAI